MIDVVRILIEDDSHMTHLQIEYFLETSSTATYSILHDYVKSPKVYAQWVPHQFTTNQKRMEIQFYQKSLERFEEGQCRRIFNIITDDESWFYRYDPETKEQ